MKFRLNSMANGLCLLLCVSVLAMTSLIASTSASNASAQRLRAIERVVGLHERKHTKRMSKMLGINPARVPWCGAAVAYAVRKAGQKPVAHQNSAKAWASYGKRVSLKNARKGDIVVFRFKRGYHTAIFKAHKGNRVEVCGGNMKDQFRCHAYLKKNVRAVRR